MVRLGGANNRRGDIGLAEHPGEGELRAGSAPLFRNLAQPVHDLTVGLFRLRVQGLAKLIRLEALGAFALPRAAQAAARERTPGNNANAFGVAERQDRKSVV